MTTRRARTIAAGSALAAALVAVSVAPAHAADTTSISVSRTAGVKATASYRTSDNRLCVSLVNSASGAEADAMLESITTGEGTGTYDATSNGSAVCVTLSAKQLKAAGMTNGGSAYLVLTQYTNSAKPKTAQVKVTA